MLRQVSIFLCLLRRELSNYIVAAQPVQSYIFGQLIGVFSINRLDDALLFWASHWALMFTILAAATGVAYFFVAWSANSLAYVSPLFRIAVSLFAIAIYFHYSSGGSYSQVIARFESLSSRIF